MLLCEHQADLVLVKVISLGELSSVLPSSQEEKGKIRLLASLRHLHNRVHLYLPMGMSPFLNSVSLDWGVFSGVGSVAL